MRVFATNFHRLLLRTVVVIGGVSHLVIWICVLLQHIELHLQSVELMYQCAIFAVVILGATPTRWPAITLVSGLGETLWILLLPESIPLIRLQIKSVNPALYSWVESCAAGSVRFPVLVNQGPPPTACGVWCASLCHVIRLTAGNGILRVDRGNV